LIEAQPAKSFLPFSIFHAEQNSDPTPSALWHCRLPPFFLFTWPTLFQSVISPPRPDWPLWPISRDRDPLSSVAPTLSLQLAERHRPPVITPTPCLHLARLRPPSSRDHLGLLLAHRTIWIKENQEENLNGFIPNPNQKQILTKTSNQNQIEDIIWFVSLPRTIWKQELLYSGALRSLFTL
jgi:hypothetical protein